MLPPAPPRFSITTGWPHASASFAPSSRATRYAGPPAGNGTITRTGFDGYCCASAGADMTEQQKKAAASACAARVEIVIVASSFSEFTGRDHIELVGGGTTRARVHTGHWNQAGKRAGIT